MLLFKNIYLKLANINVIKPYLKKNTVVCIYITYRIQIIYTGIHSL